MPTTSPANFQRARAALRFTQLPRLGAVFFASDAVLRSFLTSFLPALIPLEILLIGTWFSSVPRGLSSFFITVRRQTQTVNLYLLSIAVNALLVY